MKVIANFLALIVIVAAAYCVYIVVYAPREQLYSKVLSMHTNPLLRPKEHGCLPCLYVSRFYHNSLDGGRDYALYNDGTVIVRRITKSGVQGGSGPIQDYLELQTLKHLSALPMGLSDPDTIPHADLLIVSLHHDAWWKTYYYDRRSLPSQVQSIDQLSDVKALASIQPRCRGRLQRGSCSLS